MAKEFKLSDPVLEQFTQLFYKGYRQACVKDNADYLHQYQDSYTKAGITSLFEVLDKLGVLVQDIKSDGWAVINQAGMECLRIKKMGLEMQKREGITDE